ncbi:BREX system ATP-binding domain-containing protein [Actinoplanes sp. NPDC049599]|uniref:BREX system ATP-binding domain-containing protein n=1 Tax=Actinoplanes sp. NPDC049599 TaxID=3363903 RepID=UPI0037B96835
MSTAELGVAAYLDFVEREYLAGYIAGGGASVKLLCPADDEVRGRLASAFPELGNGYAYAEVDAVSTRIHLIDQVFTAVARQMDWVGLADAVVRSSLDLAGFPAPAGADGIDLAVIARHHDVDAAELYRSVRRAIERLVLRDAEMSHEFRVAMLRLCQERLGRGDVTLRERETVIGWLQGERLPAADLRGVGLNTKVNRYNARPLLLSLTRWLRVAGRTGLVLRLDLDRLAVTRRPPVGLRDGFYYAKAATLDAYELVRQLIDAIDEIAGLFVAVQVPTVLVHDEARGLPSYTALQMRVTDEVRDRRRQNPYAALVRLGAEATEVS